MKEIKGVYKCGHTWTTVLPMGGTKREVKQTLDRYKNTVCPKCMEKTQDKAGA